MTPLTIITSTLEHLGVLDSGQTVKPEDADKCLRALRSMLDAWQLDPQAIIGMQELTYTPGAAAASFTVGPAGNVVARQPLRLELSSYYRQNGVDMPLGIGTIEEYNSKGVKSAVGLPEFVALLKGTDTATVYIYPAATGSYQLHLWVQQDVVSGFDTLALNTSIVLPSGYQNALEWCLAEEVSDDFAISDAKLQRVIRKASIAHTRLKRANTRVAQMRMPAGVTRARSFNIFEG